MSASASAPLQVCVFRRDGPDMRKTRVHTQLQSQHVEISDAQMDALVTFYDAHASFGVDPDRHVMVSDRGQTIDKRHPILCFLFSDDDPPRPEDMFSRAKRRWLVET
jgi:hypothetical protein